MKNGYTGYDEICVAIEEANGKIFHFLLHVINAFWISFSSHWSRHVPDGAALEAVCNAKFAEYEKKYKGEAAELKSTITEELPARWKKALPVNNTSTLCFQSFICN